VIQPLELFPDSSVFVHLAIDQPGRWGVDAIDQQKQAPANGLANDFFGNSHRFGCLPQQS
jgi:hypothetical protein